MNNLQSPAVLAVVIALFLGMIIVLAGLVWIVRPWLRAAGNGVPVSFINILGMRLRGNPAMLLIDAYVALHHDRVGITIAEVERVYIVNRTRLRTSSDLADLVKSTKTAGSQSTRT
jgi:hypothetical protein